MARGGLLYHNNLLQTEKLSVVLGQEAAPLHAARLEGLPPLLDVHLVLVLDGAHDIGPREGAAAQRVAPFLFGGDPAGKD